MNLPFSLSFLAKSTMFLAKPVMLSPSWYDQQEVAEQVLSLSQQLIQRPSITPNDEGCQALIRQRLAKIGFQIEDVSRNGVVNTWATHSADVDRSGLNKDSPMLVLAGHTDVVLSGPSSLWHSEPFTPQVRDGYLYGRGAADMKTGLAALLIAAERFIKRHPDHRGKLAFAITADEEGDGYDGTPAIIDLLKKRNVIPDWCLVGEPSSKENVGDSIRVGRRGSLTAHLKIKGKQGHVAYTDAVINPIHQLNRLVTKLINKQWDFPSRYFPATSCQLVKYVSQSGAHNLTPAVAELVFNFRYSPKQSAQKLQHYIETKLKRYQLDHTITWQHDAEPYLSRNSALLKVTKQVISAANGVEPVLSTAGGTSDGRFFSALGAHVVELGVSNKTIHQCNESVKLTDLTKLVFLYEQIIEGLLA